MPPVRYKSCSNFMVNFFSNFYEFWRNLSNFVKFCWIFVQFLSNFLSNFCQIFFEFFFHLANFFKFGQIVSNFGEFYLILFGKLLNIWIDSLVISGITKVYFDHIEIIKMRGGLIKFTKIRQNLTQFDQIRKNSPNEKKIQKKFDKYSTKNSTKIQQKFDKIWQNLTNFVKIRKNLKKNSP